MIQDTKNFKRSELEYSDTAKKNKICNAIPEEYHKNANELLQVLQQIRDALGKPMTVTSAYRCEKLNQAVGGSKTSAHCVCSAADLQVKGMTNKELGCFIQGFFEGKKMAFDQIIVEKSGKSE